MTKGAYWLIIVSTSSLSNNCLFTREELAFIGSLCAENDAYAIGDEVYEHPVYDGRELVRFCFCKKDETLEKAIRRFKRWVG